MTLFVVSDVVVGETPQHCGLNFHTGKVIFDCTEFLLCADYYQGLTPTTLSLAVGLYDFLFEGVVDLQSLLFILAIG